MSRELCKAAIEGSIIATSYAEILLGQAIRRFGEETPVGYPDTAYRLPVIRSLSGEDTPTIGDLPPVLNKFKANIRHDPTLENAKLAGEATLFAAEVIEALKFINGKNPYKDPYMGFVSDAVLRKLGVPLVDDTIPGVAVIIGKARTSKDAVTLYKELQKRGILVIMVNDIIEQLLEEGMRLGADYMAFPLGHFTAAIHAVNFALRAGLAFGGIAPGKRGEMLKYQAERVDAFVLALGELDEVRIAAEFGAIHLGFPVVTDQQVEEIPDLFVYEPDYVKMVQRALELRNIKIKIVDIPIPVTFGPAFEGERIRKEDMHVEFGGQRSPAFELVRMRAMDEVEDGKITVIGPEIDEVAAGTAMPLGIMVDVAGRKMQEDFEPVLERRVHYFINYAEGCWHIAQRDICWMRISRDAFNKGFRVRHFGEILYAKFKSDFPAIVDRVQVTLITDRAQVLEQLEVARKKYAARDARLAGLTDESVDTFYSCTLCQSFAPNHVCIVAPERIGLCGAVSWLDAKASFEITPTGPNQPIVKGECIEPVKGQWVGVNEFLKQASHNTLDTVNIYTLLENPMTSCGCFECIMAILPEANGVMIVNREFSGMTPCGMKFSTLAGSVGGGVQTPGFMGHGRSYVLSRKFIAADGGLARVVWMPKEVKEFLKEGLVRRAAELGLNGFYNKIADETVGTTIEEILPFLEEKGHPALSMPPLM
ncbi:MAG: acetyl-CoA decarbonylase/synthase complex subunit alpha/beta [Bacillota bacterium]